MLLSDDLRLEGLVIFANALFKGRKDHDLVGALDEVIRFLQMKLGKNPSTLETSEMLYKWLINAYDVKAHGMLHAIRSRLETQLLVNRQYSPFTVKVVREVINKLPSS